MYFTEKKNSAKIKAIIEDGLKNGLSSNKIQKELSSQGLGYKREYFLKDLKNIKTDGFNGPSLPSPGPYPKDNISANQPKEKRVSKGPSYPRAANPRTNKDKPEPVYKDLQPKTGKAEKTEKSRKPANPAPSKSPKKSRPAREKEQDPSPKTSRKPEKTLYDFSEKNYSFTGGKEAQKKEDILRQVVKDTTKRGQAGKGAGKEYIKRLKEAGLSYRKTDMEKDVRRALTIEHAKTPEAKQRAARFYDSVYENARQMLKKEGRPYNRKAVNKFIDDWKKGSLDISKRENELMMGFYAGMDIEGSP